MTGKKTKAGMYEKFGECSGMGQSEKIDYEACYEVGFFRFTLKMVQQRKMTS